MYKAHTLWHQLTHGIEQNNNEKSGNKTFVLEKNNRNLYITTTV